MRVVFILIFHLAMHHQEVLVVEVLLEVELLEVHQLLVLVVV